MNNISTLQIDLRAMPSTLIRAMLGKNGVSMMTFLCLRQIPLVRYVLNDGES